MVERYPLLAPHGRLEMPTADGAAAVFARHPAALRLSVSCQLRMNNLAPSSTRRNHLPVFCAAFRRPSAYYPYTATAVIE